MPITAGASYTCETMVTKENTALAVGSGSLEVFATPMMIALMEQAAAQCIQPALEEGQTSVGIQIEAAHQSATPLGLRVWATATVTGVDGRKVSFELSAKDEAGPIGKGTHTRFVVDAQPFMEKALAKTPAKTT